MINWRTAARSIRALRRRRARALARWRLRGRAGHADPFGHIEFVIVDVETTGWTPAEAAITEIGAVLVRGGQVYGQFSCLINPGTAIPPSVAALTGIDDAMVAAAPSLRAVLPAFLAFARDCVLTAHNAPFDLSFLQAACRECGLLWPGFQVLDTADLARRVMADGEVTDCKLATLAEFFHATTRPVHRALPDALATADVLTGLLRRLAASGVRTLAEAGASHTGASPANGEARPATGTIAANGAAGGNGAAGAGGAPGRAAAEATPGIARAC